MSYFPTICIAMKISKQEEYGLRCILQLAKQGRARPLAVSEIAKLEGLSTDYVTKLLILLRRAGLVSSVRGLRGGYQLTHDAEDISMTQVLRALGGYFYSEENCNMYTGKLAVCAHAVECGIRPVWVALSRQIDQILSRTSLSDVLREEQEVRQMMDRRAEQIQQLAAKPAATGQ